MPVVDRRQGARAQGSREARSVPAHDSALAHGLSLTVSQLMAENRRLRALVFVMCVARVESAR